MLCIEGISTFETCDKTIEELERDIEILQHYINGKQSRIDYLKMK